MAGKKDEKKKAEVASTTKKAEKKDKSNLLDKNGKFAKGHKKVGGRQAGTPNRNSSIRDKLKEQVEPFIQNIAENLIRVQKEEGTAAMMALQEKFMPYFMPKYSSMSFSADQDRPISEEERLLELDTLYTKKEISINIKNLTIVDNDKLRTSEDDDEDNFDLSIFNTTSD